MKSLFLLLSLITIPAFCCSFQIEGVNDKNFTLLKNNLKNINSEFEINKEGKLHFYSKAEVTADQVNLVLKKTDIKLMLKPSDHKSH